MEERLGEGAVGVVYRAVHIGLEKSFAIKLLKTSGPPAHGALARFRREAVALGRLRHPHIVEVTDFGVEGSEGGLPYIVTELLEGRPLSEVCRDQGPMPLAKALPLLGQIAAAIDAAHDAGVLHRDLKPGNVFVCSESPESPSVKVLDFGLAELLAGPSQPSSVTSPGGEQSSPRLTTTGLLLGTPLYLAPELVRHGEASRSSDIYSFGVLAYEILGGKPPFQGTLKEVLAGHLKAEPPFLPLPPAVWRPLREALRKAPSLRPGTAGEIVRRCLGGESEAEWGRRRSIEIPGRWRIPHFGTIWQTLESWMILLLVAVISLALFGAFGLMIGRGPVPPTGNNEIKSANDFAENKNDGAERPVESQQPPIPLGEWRPPEPRYSTASAPPRGTLGFNDIQKACGDLSALSNYICLVNQGNQKIAGGRRLVLREDRASFIGRFDFPSGVEVEVEGEKTYRFDFSPPKGKALIPGLYTGAARGPRGPYPGIDVSIGSYNCTKEGQFRILQVMMTPELKIRRFVADVETDCNGVIGRIAVGDHRPAPSMKSQPRQTEPPSSTAPVSPGVPIGFDEIGQACGDLSYLPNYLCLVNHGFEQVARSARFVIKEDQASFTGFAHPNGRGVTINVEGKERYSFDFGPPQGKVLVAGLYAGATGWSSQRGLFPGIGVTVGSNYCEGEGQFRILQILLAGEKVRRLVADFETKCNGGIGRIAVGGEKTEIKMRRAT